MNLNTVFPFYNKETYKNYVTLIKQKRAYLKQIIKDIKLEIKDLQRRNVTTVVRYDELEDIRVELKQWTQLSGAAKVEAAKLYELSNHSNLSIKKYVDVDCNVNSIFLTI